MADQISVFTVMSGSDNITSDCVFYANDAITTLQGSIWNDSFTTSDVNLREGTIYVEYESIKYSWSEYTIGGANTADISQLNRQIIPAISKVRLPDNSVHDIRDSRITGVDSTPTSGSTNIVTSDGIYTAIQGIDTISYYTNLEVDTILTENW